MHKWLIVNLCYFHFMGELIQFEMSIKNPTSLLVGIHIFNLVAYFPIVQEADQVVYDHHQSFERLHYIFYNH